MKVNKFIVFTVSVMLFLGCALVSCQGQISSEKKGKISAPDFTLDDLYGQEFKLSYTKGKVVIIDFWATWCPPCKMEIPHLNSLYKQYAKSGLEVIGIALDDGGAGVVRPFAEENKIEYTILMGDRKVEAAYGGIRGIPTIFIIDREGRIVEKFVGYRERNVLENVIKKLI
ncbi:MAG: TlpA disulfide reductase family protein [Candidatus Omnitrophica bacterium]|nr:TlpA disulfide reductase family protein [Candidatus Omnitrophota bacterium]